MKKTRSIAGFTLIEMSIVLIVVSLILAGVLKTVGIQRQQLKRDETRQQLETIKEALIGFALTNGRLPCPDTGNDGIENPANPANGEDCDANEGMLPHVDIGIGNSDVWGNRFRYHVSGSGVNSFADDVPHPPLPAATQAANSSFGVNTDGTIVINDNEAAEPGVAVISNNIPAIVVSYAENGAQQQACGAGLSLREQENCDGDVNFVDSFYSEVAGQEYDDLVVWIPLTVLKSRMVESALLP